MTPQDVEELAKNAAIEMHIPGKSNIITAGDIPTSFHIVKQGVAVMSSATHDIRKLYPGDFFGELDLGIGAVRKYTVRAVEETVIIPLRC